MSVMCFSKYNVAVSPKLFKKLFLRVSIRSNSELISKLTLRKHFQSSSTQFTKREATKFNNVHNLRRLFSLAKPEKYQLAAAVGLLVISSSVTMSIPFAMGKIIDMIYRIDQMKSNNEHTEGNKQETELLTADEKNQIMNKLRKFCVVLVGVFTVGAVANFGRVYLMRMISQRIAARIRHSFYSSTGT